MLKIQEEIDSVIEDLSRVRLKSYAPGGSYGPTVLQSYRHNIVLGHVIWEAAAILEVLLRNRIVKHWNEWLLSKGFDLLRGEWPMGVSVIHHQIPRILPSIKIKTKNLRKLEKQVKYVSTQTKKEVQDRKIVNGDIVARMTFGFWHLCLSKHFRFINGSGGKKIFTHYPFKGGIESDLSQISKDLQSIKGIRNRIAHHEKLDSSKAKRNYKKICDYIGYINPYALKLVSVDGFNHILNFNIKDVTRDFPYL